MSGTEHDSGQRNDGSVVLCGAALAAITSATMKQQHITTTQISGQTIVEGLLLGRLDRVTRVSVSDTEERNSETHASLVVTGFVRLPEPSLFYSAHGDLFPDCLDRIQADLDSNKIVGLFRIRPGPSRPSWKERKVIDGLRQRLDLGDMDCAPVLGLLSSEESERGALHEVNYRFFRPAHSVDAGVNQPFKLVPTSAVIANLNDQPLPYSEDTNAGLEGDAGDASPLEQQMQHGLRQLFQGHPGQLGTVWRTAPVEATEKSVKQLIHQLAGSRSTTR